MSPYIIRPRSLYYSVVKAVGDGYHIYGMILFLLFHTII